MATTKNKWAIDPAHTEVQFKVKHLVISTVTGNFNKFEGNVLASDDEFSGAEVEFSADVDSINTNQADRDGHLKSPDFFNAGQYPKLTFKSTGFIKKADNQYKLSGNLTIRDVTKPIELDVEYGGITKDPWGNIKAGFEVSGKFNRKDFGLTWNALTEAGGMVVAEEVKILVNVELTKQ